MSVLVKGIQMPKNCKECPFLLDDDACYAVNKPNSWFLPLVCNGSTDEYPLNEFPYWEKRVDWCPLVEISKPHGRLIDHKKLEKDLAKRWNTNDDQDFCNKEVWHALEEAPTVIEAEGE